jgi:hypothetical protein
MLDRTISDHPMMAKIGRNAQCPCGSASKYKHCCGRLVAAGPSTLQDRIAAEDQQRRQQQGHGRPISFFPDKDGLVVPVGLRLIRGQWQSFHSFLLDYIAITMGQEWFSLEMAKGEGEGHHPAGMWANAMQQPVIGGTTDAPAAKPANNAMRAMLAFAYNLYLIEHHYKQYDQPLFKRLLKRLHDPSEFFPTLAETYAAASFLKAGFHLHYEDERKRGHHPEFVATHPKTGKKFSVEVKSRSGVDRPEAETAVRLRIGNKIAKALAKNVPWSRVLFIDVNIPDVVTLDGRSWIDDVMAEVETAEVNLRFKEKPAPPAYIFVMNHPYHFNRTSMLGPPVVGALGFRTPDFNPRHASFRDIVLGRKKHIEMTDLIASLKVHTEPPVTFDGQAPEFAFARDHMPRLIIGNKYLVPGPPDGEEVEVEAELENALMVEQEKLAYGIYATSAGVRFVATTPMTDIELAAYRRHPETFFGKIQHVGAKAESAFELAEFFYETYQHTSKEKLIEFMAGHPSIEQLRAMSQEDLAIFYCEMCALSADQNAFERSIANPGKDEAARPTPHQSAADQTGQR